MVAGPGVARQVAGEQGLPVGRRGVELAEDVGKQDRRGRKARRQMSQTVGRRQTVEALKRTAARRRDGGAAASAPAGRVRAPSPPRSARGSRPAARSRRWGRRSPVRWRGGCQSASQPATTGGTAPTAGGDGAARAGGEPRRRSGRAGGRAAGRQGRRSRCGDYAQAGQVAVAQSAGQRGGRNAILPPLVLSRAWHERSPARSGTVVGTGFRRASAQGFPAMACVCRRQHRRAQYVKHPGAVVGDSGLRRRLLIFERQFRYPLRHAFL